MTEQRPRGRAPLHRLVMALRHISEIPGGPRYTAFDRPRQLYRVTTATTVHEMTAADVPAYLCGCADAARALTTAASGADPLTLLAGTFQALNDANTARTLPTGTRLAPYLQGASDAAQTLAASPVRKRRIHAATYAQAALQALGTAP